MIKTRDRERKTTRETGDRERERQTETGGQTDVRVARRAVLSRGRERTFQTQPCLFFMP